MSATFTYAAFDGSWSVNLGTQAVRLATVDGFTEIAELGAVGESTIVIDDPSANVGHTSDAILALQQFYVDESAATTARIYAGWTDDRTYTRGTSPRVSLRTGSARQIEVTLRDGNTLAGRLIIPPVATDATVSRPQETAAARITWLLGSGYLPGVSDYGLVNPASVTLDANDYSGQNPADVLNDCCVANGDNWFIRWNRTNAAYELVVYNMTTYYLDAGTLQLSNDLSIIDSTIEGGAGVTDTWAVAPDAVLHRSAASYCDRVLLPYAKGTVYRTTTSATFPDVTHSAPSTSVKTLTAANTQADRFLTDNADEADRITCSAQIAAANVNDALAGQLIAASFTHLPGYSTLSFFRIARRTVSQVEPTDQFYTCSYELVPATPTYPTSSFARIDYGMQDHNPHVAPTSAILQYEADGDNPMSGWTHQPKFGLMTYDATGLAGPQVPGVPKWTGIKMLGGGTVSIYCGISWNFVVSGCTITLDILKNGVTVVATTSMSQGVGTPSFVQNTGLTPTGIAVSNGDIISARLSWTVTPAIGIIPASGVWSWVNQLKVWGDLA